MKTDLTKKFDECRMGEECPTALSSLPLLQKGVGKSLRQGEFCDPEEVGPA